MLQKDVQRGQSFNLDSSRPFIYYYSVLKPLPESIINDLILCLKLKPNLQKALPSIWYTMAQQTVALEKDGVKKFVTWNYLLDQFTYIWMTTQEIEKQTFQQEIQERFAKFNVEQEYLTKLVEIFYKIVPSVILQIQETYCKQESLNYDQSCVKPLVVFREKSKNGDSSVIKMIEDLNLDDGKSESTLSSSQISMKQQGNFEGDRSKSDMRDVTLNLQMGRMKKFTKQMVKMTENIFQQLLQTQFAEEQWQVARQFVVIILEMNIKADDYIKQYEKVRFLQPATLFYKKALQIWMLEKSSSQNKLVFSQFICKAKSYFSKQWTDQLTIPLYLVFQQVESILAVEMNNMKDQISLIHAIVKSLRDKLNENWEQNIIANAKGLLQN